MAVSMTIVSRPTRQIFRQQLSRSDKCKHLIGNNWFVFYKKKRGYYWTSRLYNHVESDKEEIDRSAPVPKGRYVFHQYCNALIPVIRQPIDSLSRGDNGNGEGCAFVTVINDG